MLFHDYFWIWIDENKTGSVKSVTLGKYKMTHKWLLEIAPDLDVENMTRKDYQAILNKYGETHEHLTMMDFHRQLKSCIMDALDEGILKRDPTRKAVVRGKIPIEKRKKYLSLQELSKVLSILELEKNANWDWFILLIAKTGMRFSEALAVTPSDFEFKNHSIRINKSWDYKGTENGAFIPTKNVSSVRTIDLDDKTVEMFRVLVEHLPKDKPIFVPDNKRVFNSTVNSRMTRLCELASVPVIGIHGLRHTHASLLIYIGVSIPGVARRLGHANTTTTQKTYIHIIQELENRDKELAMSHLVSIG